MLTYLACSVPQPYSVGFAVYHAVSGIVVEYCRDVLGREAVGRVGDQQAALAHRSITQHQ